MKHPLFYVGLVAALAAPVHADDRPVTPPLQAAYAPRLGDIMGATQLRHLKLWYAGKDKNWGLAAYELGQIKDSFRDAMIYYPDLPVANMTTMAEPAARINAAIKAKNSARFARAFTALTAACNNCHRTQGYGFIVIKIPVSSPFSNQSFPPQ